MNTSNVIAGWTAAQMSHPKVLIVDDHPANLMALSELLRRDDVELLVAESGAEALELLLVHDVAVALIDVQMPEMGGFELAELMRGVERAKHVPIIFVTAGTRDADRRFRGYEAGAVDFLYKPIELDVLKSKVNVFLALNRQRRELSRLVEERKEVENALRESEARLQFLTNRLEQTVKERTGELVESQGRLRALASELNLAEQRERARLAAEMHDHLQQILVLGKLKLSSGKRFAVGLSAVEQLIHETEEIFDEALQYTHSLVAELSPPVLRDHGLCTGLRWLGEYMEKYEMAVTVTVPEDRELELSEDKVILLFQSVRELLINSAKYAETGRAVLTLEQRDERLYITVRDEGKGFDPGAAAVTPSEARSTKFGLFSIKERMRSLGGELELETSPGKGTTATLVLPLRDAERGEVLGVKSGEENNDVCVAMPGYPEMASAGTAINHQGSGIVSRAIRVLLVDDHAMMRQGLRAMLEGYEDVQVVGEAVDGLDAVRLAEQLRPRIVVMDINMPKMNGIEATREIRSRNPHSIVIGLSVNADDANRNAMIQAGAATLITKEAAVDQLHQTMLAMLKDVSPVA
jgi:DNA-binding NarL/FixJ family response regulator/anti-sigma regulatory factor (Ser/Thr protein kinase)